MIEDKFGLKDEEYWSGPWRTRQTLQRPLMLKGQEGMVLGAPATVALNQRQSFPVALIRVSKLTTLGKIPSRSTLIITTMDLGSNELRARLALPPLAREAGNSGRANAGSGRDSFSGDDTAMVAEAHTIDLASRVRLPAARGEYLVTAILFDQVSNRCRMKVSESAGYDDPAVDEFLQQYRARRLHTPKVFPKVGTPLPSYRRQDNSPAIPAELGVALSVTRVNVFAPGARCILTGSFRLPIRPQNIVKPVKAGTESAVVPEETAIIPISLLITGSADATPQIVKLVVPSYGPLESTAHQTIATGYFSFDLCGIANLLVAPQTHFIYAFSGEVMTAAVPTAFVRLPEEELDGAGSW